MLVTRYGYGEEGEHSIEEIRAATYEILKRSRGDGSGQYGGLKAGVAQYFQETGGPKPQQLYGHQNPDLSTIDANRFLEVFWGLFREGIITLGANDLNPNFPWYRVSEFGRQLLNNQDPYFFTDVSDYERMIKSAVPAIDDVALLYAKEAVQTFKIGSLLSSSVMIGVASEHIFNTVLDTVETNPAWSTEFAKPIRETRILPRLVDFKKVLDSKVTLTPAIKEDLETRFMGIISLIRTFRNDAGHPTGKILDRQQAYINLQLFVPYAGKLYQLLEFFTP